MQRSTLLIFSLFIFLVAPVSGQMALKADPEAAGLAQDRLQRYEQFLEGQIEEGNIAGAVSLIYRKGTVAHSAAYGLSDLGEKTPMTEENIFHIMSMTKPIISVAFMMLFEEGHFHLHDKVSDYLPQFKDLQVNIEPAAGIAGKTEPAESDIRIHQLLSHTAGFTHGLGGTKIDNEIAFNLYYLEHEDIESRVNTLVSKPLVAQPGSKWYYSASPDVLALLIEHFSGQTALEFIQERLFDPLGMKDTYYNVPAEKLDRVAKMHKKDENGILVVDPQAMPPSGHTIWGGTHGLLSTAEDYLKFCRMLLNGGQLDGRRYLSRKTVELMTMNHVGDMQPDPGQGFGLGFGVTIDLAEEGNLGSIGRFFWNGAYSTFFFIDPEEELIAILMTQTTPYSDFLQAKLRQFVYQAIND